MYVIYLITNTINNKKYVGQTKEKDPMTRFKGHISDSIVNSTNNRFHNAIRKYGPENFKFEILERDIPENLVDEREIYYISKYNSRLDGYNDTDGGQGIHGYRHTDKTKRLIGDSHRGKPRSEETKRKISAAQKGKKLTDEHKLHLRQSLVGKRYGSDNPFYGKTHSVATRNKVSDANTRHHVLQLDAITGEVLRKFKNRNEAAKWILEQGLTNALLGTCSGRIGFVCSDTKNTERIAYGFKWKYEEECND